MSAEQRVVITGTGSVSALGLGVDALWDGVRAGRSGIRPITAFDTNEMPIGYAGTAPDVESAPGLKHAPQVRREKSLMMGLTAAGEALRQARLINDDDHAVNGPVGVVAGSGLGPCHEAETSYGAFFEKGWRGVRPTTVPRTMFNALSSHLSIHFGLTGGNHVISAACASGPAALAHGYLLIRSGQESTVLAGGSDSPLCPSMFAAWTNLRVLARHESPQAASRPFDRKRNGLVLAEGACFLVLESLASAQRRGAPILAELAGVGSSSDAHHLTATNPAGQALAMRRCLDSAGARPEEVDYVNAHGTSTELNDRVEGEAIVQVFGPRGPAMPVSSTKSMLGHSLGASGALEAAICVRSIQDGFVPPTINCDDPDPRVGLDYTPHVGREHPVRLAMSNAFAFGGNNTVLLFRRFE
jgi:3-oxoacyl-[acyl-carrier-protein] synthase II